MSVTQITLVDRLKKMARLGTDPPKRRSRFIFEPSTAARYVKSPWELFAQPWRP